MQFVEEFPPGNVPPDLYVTPAPSPAYSVLAGFMELGLAEDRGERYAEDGTKLVAVEVRGRGAFQRNAAGSIRIGREFFTTAVKDYEDWQEKWWREAVQNAVDAGAQHIDCNVTQQVDGSYQIVVTDDGGGMDEDVLINKFLVLGGTTKTLGSTTGGFGKAKELLVLPWISWVIHTRDRIVRGAGIDYEVNPAEFRSGTQLTVVMPADQTTHAAAALAYIGKSLLPTVAFTVNGESVRANLRVGEPVREFGGTAALYYTKKAAPFRGSLLVRTNGLYMFSRYVSSTVPGQLIVELLRPSVELLTANRDGFRDRLLQRQIDDYVNELAADTSSALRKKAGLVREKFIGSGKFSAELRRDITASSYEALGSLEPQGRASHGARHYLSTEQIASVIGVLDRALPTEAADDQLLAELAGEPRFVASGALAAELLASIDLSGPTQVQSAIKQLAWEPDFFLINEIEGWRVPKKFYPATMTRNIRKLARFWAEMCRFVLMQLGSEHAYGVGFQFDADVGASYLHDENQHWLLLNPFVHADPRREEALWLLSKWDDVMWLYAAAVHECTHMADGISYHDESFAAALTRNFARTSGKEKQIRAIKRIVGEAER